MANDLSGFFTGLKAGADIMNAQIAAEDNAYDRELKNEILLQKIAEENYTQPDRLNEKLSALRYNLLANDANAYKVLNTTEGVVDATNARNRYIKTLNENKSDGLDLYGDDQNYLELLKTNLGIGRTTLDQDILGATKKQQLQTAISNANTNQVKADLGERITTDTQEAVYNTGVNTANAGELSSENKLIDQRVENTVNKKTEDDQVKTGVAKILGLKLDEQTKYLISKNTQAAKVAVATVNAMTDEQKANTAYAVGEITKAVDIEMARQKNIDATIKGSELRGDAVVGAIIDQLPDLPSKIRKLESIIRDSKNPDQRASAIRILNQIKMSGTENPVGYIAQNSTNQNLVIRNGRIYLNGKEMTPEEVRDYQKKLAAARGGTNGIDAKTIYQTEQERRSDISDAKQKAYRSYGEKRGYDNLTPEIIKQIDDRIDAAYGISQSKGTQQTKQPVDPIEQAKRRTLNMADWIRNDTSVNLSGDGLIIDARTNQPLTNAQSQQRYLEYQSGAR